MYKNLDFTIGDVKLSGFAGQFPAFTIATFNILRQSLGVGTPDADIRGTFEDETRNLFTRVNVGDEEVHINTEDIFLETVVS